ALFQMMEEQSSHKKDTILEPAQSTPGNQAEVEVFYAIIEDYFTEEIVEKNEISWTTVEEIWDDMWNNRWDEEEFN
ncbi:13015_t:CDS:1, partial [Racocetra persica]